jgi:hypothetical protein
MFREASQIFRSSDSFEMLWYLFTFPGILKENWAETGDALESPA